MIFGKAWDEFNGVSEPRMIAFFTSPFRQSSPEHESDSDSGGSRRRRHYSSGPRRSDPSSSIIGLVSKWSHRIDVLSTTSSICSDTSLDPFGCLRSARITTGHAGYFKSIYANAKRQDQFFLFVEISSNERVPYVLFKTSKIRVISKPSKKKQNIKMSGMTIESGSLVAFYNRVRSQSITTRYLKCSQDGSGLVVDPLEWDSFVIWKVNDPRFDPLNYHSQSIKVKIQQQDKTRLVLASKTNPFIWTHPDYVIRSDKGQQHDLETVTIAKGYPLREENEPIQGNVELRYGDVVCLQNTLTGAVLKPMIVRRVDNKTQICRVTGEPAKEDPGTFVLTPAFTRKYLEFSFNSEVRGDPISQLHKISLELLEKPGCFLCLSEDPERIVIGQSSVQHHRRERWEELHESSIWTITGIDQIETTVYSDPSNAIDGFPYHLDIHPVPIVDDIVKTADSLILTGRNLNAHPYRVFLGSLQATIDTYSANVLTLEFGKNFQNLLVTSNLLEPSVPVLLVRQDGIVFRCGIELRL